MHYKALSASSCALPHGVDRTHLSSARSDAVPTETRRNLWPKRCSTFYAMPSSKDGSVVLTLPFTVRSTRTS